MSGLDEGMPRELGQTQPARMEPLSGTARRLKRGGVMAGIAGVLAGALSSVTPQRAQARDGEPLVAGQENAASQPTALRWEGAATNLPALEVSTSGRAIFGWSTNTGPGVWGATVRGYGVVGETLRGYGVFGSATARALGGIFGQGPTGVWGRGVASDDPVVPSHIGVRGTTDSGAGTGVQGIAESGTGLAGASKTGTAVRGTVQDASQGIAGHFVGPVLIEGNLTTTGAVSVAVMPSDGATRRLQVMVSRQEGWVEDFGTAQLVNGRATVPLHPDFGALVRSDDYHVFLTPRGNSRGLYVSDLGPPGFEVREQLFGRTDIAFSYRVVARRKDAPVPSATAVNLPTAVKAPDPVEAARNLQVPELPKAPVTTS